MMRDLSKPPILKIQPENSDATQLIRPVTIAGEHRGGMGLAPVAVLPSHQKRGIGKQLIQAGLDTCRAQSVPFVVVLGEPA